MCEKKGVVRDTSEIELIDKSIYIGGRSIEADLGNEEKAVLELLLRHRGEVVSVDSLADILWGEGELKSFWAVTKLLQRVRKKVNKLSGGSLKVSTARGRGYVLS